MIDMQISKILLLLVAIGITLTIGISHPSAIEENITFEELEIIPDPNRENLYSYILNVCDNEFEVAVMNGYGIKTIKYFTILCSWTIRIEPFFNYEYLAGNDYKIKPHKNL